MKNVALLIGMVSALLTSVVASAKVNCRVIGTDSADYNKILIEADVPPPNPNKRPGELNPHIYFLVKKDLPSARLTTAEEVTKMQKAGYGSDDGDTIVTLQETDTALTSVIINKLDSSSTHAWDDYQYSLTNVNGSVQKLPRGLMIWMPILNYAVECLQK